jgi:thiamine biosynthesis lipoprotein
MGKFHRQIVVCLPLLLGLLLAACSHQANVYEQKLYVFGTLVDITLRGVTEEQGRQVSSLIDADFQRMHHDWHAWEPGPLTEINTAIAAGKNTPVIPSLLPIIERSADLYRQSDGLFNPAIGGLLSVWGFQRNEPPSGPPPDKNIIKQWLAQAPGMDAIRLKDGVLSSSNPAVQLDFGAFAKGYAVDLAIEKLQAHGIQNAIVNAGGDLRAFGTAEGRPWRVGVRHPQGYGVLASIDINGDESVFTSGNYERYREHEGLRYPHILDPRTGMPVQDVTSVTVIHSSGADADAAATALVVAGPREWHRIAKKMGIKYVMLVDGEGAVYMNPAMQHRVEFQGTSPARLVVSEPLGNIEISIKNNQ